MSEALKRVSFAMTATLRPTRLLFASVPGFSGYKLGYGAVLFVVLVRGLDPIAGSVAPSPHATRRARQLSISFRILSM